MRPRLAIGAVLVAMVAVIVWFLRRESAGSARVTATGTAERTAAAKRAQLPATARHRGPVRLAMPPPAVAPIVVPEACAHGTGGTDDWWACLPRDPTWDAERASYLLDRISTHIGLVLEPGRLECRTRCCRLHLTHEENLIHGGELGSSVGVVVGPTDGYLRTRLDPSIPDSDLIVTACWKPGPLDDYPDRAVEREIVLAEAADDLAACATLPDAPTEATLTVELTNDGGIDTISHGTSMPRSVMQCISAAIEKVGVFEPAPTPMSRMIPMRVRLQR